MLLNLTIDSSILFIQFLCSHVGIGSKAQDLLGLFVARRNMHSGLMMLCFGAFQYFALKERVS